MRKGSRGMQYGSSTRGSDGCIVQFEHRSTGELRSVVKQGNHSEKVGTMLRAAIEEMETWEGEWWVSVISSPTTILTDLQGSRQLQSNQFGHHVETPEVRQLAMIGRQDLIRPPRRVSMFGLDQLPFHRGR